MLLAWLADIDEQRKVQVQVQLDFFYCEQKFGDTFLDFFTFAFFSTKKMDLIRCHRVGGAEPIADA